MDVLNHLLWLKVRLVGRTWKNVSGSLLALLGMVVATSSSLSGGILLTLGTLELGPDLGRVILGGVLGTVYLGWVLAPAFGYRLNDSLDPQVFSHLPVPTWLLSLGLFLGNFLDPVVLISLPLLGGGVLAGAMLGGNVVFGILGAFLLLFHAMGTAQIVHAGSLAVLRSRRTSEVLFVGLALLLLAALVAFEVGVLSTEQGGEMRSLVQIAEDWRWIDHVVCWTPPGLAMECMMPTRPGSVFGALPACLLLQGIAILSVWLGGFLTSRILSGETLGGGGGQSQQGSGRDRLVEFFRRLSGSGVLAGRAAAECRLALREPQYLLLYISYPLAYGAASYWAATVPGLDHASRIVVLGIIVLSSIFLFTGVVFNALAVERNGLRLVFSGPVDPLVYLVGKNLGMWLLLSGVHGLVVIFSCLSGSLSLFTMVSFWLAGQASILVLLGIGNLGSVLAPIPLPEKGGGVRGSASFGRVFRVMMVNSLGMTFGAMAAGLSWFLLLAVPAYLGGGKISLLLFLLGMAWLAGIYCLGTWMGASLLVHRQEEILETLAK